MSLKKILLGVSLSVVAVSLAYAQAQAPGRGGRGAVDPRDLPGGTAAAGGRGADAGLQRSLPSQNQWDNMNDKGKAYVAKSKELAGNDPDLVLDQTVFCKPSGGSQNSDRAQMGAPVGAPYQPIGSPEQAQFLPPQHMFDNFWYFGTTGVGAWLWTTNDGYVLFDAGNDADEAQELILNGMRKVGLDPNKIKYMVFGHNHLDHTGGGHLIQMLYKPRVIMGRDDWDIYLRTMEGARSPNAGGQAARIKDKIPMTRDMDAEDGMTIKVGNQSFSIYTITGHTPGSIGAIFPVRWQGKNHNILIVTAATDAKSREAFVGGYEHIWDIGIKNNVEAVFQVHPNTNMNTLGRLKYVNDNYAKLAAGGQNPMLYGVDKTKRYINIMRNCTLARFEALGR